MVRALLELQVAVAQQQIDAREPADREQFVQSDWPQHRFRRRRMPAEWSEFSAVTATAPATTPGKATSSASSRAAGRVPQFHRQSGSC